MKIEIELDRESYSPLDIVYVKVSTRRTEGRKVSRASVSYSVCIGEGREGKGIPMSTQGEAYFSFHFPISGTHSGSIKVEVEEEGMERAVALHPLTILPHPHIFLDIVPESGYILPSAPNTIYIQATDIHGESAS